MASPVAVILLASVSHGNIANNHNPLANSSSSIIMWRSSPFI